MGANAAVSRREEDIFPLRHHYDSSVGHSGLIRIIQEAKVALSENGIEYEKHEGSTIEAGEFLSEFSTSIGVLVARAPVKRSGSAQMVFDRKPSKEP